MKLITAQIPLLATVLLAGCAVRRHTRVTSVMVPPPPEFGFSAGWGRSIQTVPQNADMQRSYEYARPIYPAPSEPREAPPAAQPAPPPTQQPETESEPERSHMPESPREDDTKSGTQPTTDQAPAAAASAPPPALAPPAPSVAPTPEAQALPVPETGTPKQPNSVLILLALLPAGAIGIRLLWRAGKSRAQA